jgi:hypothetical protein
MQVSANSLTGQPAVTVIQRLQRLGLRPRVRWDQDGQEEPGTVTAMQPWL